MDAAGNIWMLAVACGVLTGWWLAVRPGATYRGVSTSMSVLIVTCAVLMTVLALDQQKTTRATAVARVGVLVPDDGAFTADAASPSFRLADEPSRTLP